VGKGGLETLGILKAIFLLCSGDALRKDYSPFNGRDGGT